MPLLHAHPAIATAGPLSVEVPWHRGSWAEAFPESFLQDLDRDIFDLWMQIVKHGDSEPRTLYSLNGFSVHCLTKRGFTNPGF